MRFSEFSGKEIIDLNNGERIGVVGQTDLLIDPNTGEIDALVLPKGKMFRLSKKNNDEVLIPWKAIRKIGPEMIIVENRREI